MSRQLTNNRNIKHPAPPTPLQQQQQQQQPQQQIHQQPQIISRIVTQPNQNQIQQQLITNATSGNIQITNLGNSNTLGSSNEQTILRIASNNQNSFIYYTPAQHTIIPITAGSTPTILTKTINVTPTVATPPQQLQQIQIPATATTPTTHILSPSSPIAKKRLKLDTETVVNTITTVTNTTTTVATCGPVTTCSTVNNSPPEDLNALKKRILEYKYMRLKSLKDK
jgi:hypothetical protein